MPRRKLAAQDATPFSLAGRSMIVAFDNSKSRRSSLKR
jgi:hypothetical protein